MSTERFVHYFRFIHFQNVFRISDWRNMKIAGPNFDIGRGHGMDIWQMYICEAGGPRCQKGDCDQNDYCANADPRQDLQFTHVAFVTESMECSWIEP